MATPRASGFPHYSNGDAKHLHRCTDGRWCFSNCFRPEQDGSIGGMFAFIFGHAAVPVGEASWNCYDFDAKKWVDMPFE